jgi:UDP-N-acetylglucosamine diphosphorylase/glucosamine-1-phosphate N-acetyltransferase
LSISFIPFPLRGLHLRSLAVAIASPIFCLGWKAVGFNTSGPIFSSLWLKITGLLALPEVLEGPWAFINARLVPHMCQFTGQIKESSPTRFGVRGLAQQLGGPGTTQLFAAAGRGPSARFEDFLRKEIENRQIPASDLKLPLFEYPHEVIKYHTTIMKDNLEDRISRGDYKQLNDGLFVGQDVVLGDYLTVNTGRGPVIIESHTRVGPCCYLEGPVFIGSCAKLIENTALKDNVALGHTTKVGGEVEASTIEPYTNKQHHGFIGHSYLGSWVNLGAGTCNSDLKNTYGLVTMEYNGQRVPTGMQFMGCIIGDYTKTAVNTGIFTGKVIGVCCMVYGFVTTNVPSFTNYARLFGQMTEVPVEVAVAGQQRMFLRRNVLQRPCDIQLIHDMYELTRHERRLGNEPLVL